MKSSQKIIKYGFIVLFFMIIISGIYIKSSNILHIVGKIYSPDKATKLVVYVNKNGDTKKDSVNIKVYNNDGRYKTAISFFGLYGGIFWTSDSSKYVIKTKEYISNIYIVDKNSGNITGIDTNLDLALHFYINNNPDFISSTIDEKSITDYEFIQWEKDTETMLIYYEISDLYKNVHSGYFLYDYKNNKIMGMLASAQ